MYPSKSNIKCFAIFGSFIIAFFFFGFLPTCAAEHYTAVIDHHDTPIEWYYNRSGGDRGLIKDASASLSNKWDNDSSYTFTVDNHTGSWAWFGMFYNIVRNGKDNIELPPRAIFGPKILLEYQAKVDRISVVVNNLNSASNNSNLSLKIELRNSKDQTILHYTWNNIYDPNNMSYPHTFEIAIESSSITENVKMITWVLDNALAGDSISVESVNMGIQFDNSLNIDKEMEFFIWNYSWLLYNFDSASYMVQDRSNFENRVYENVSATGKTAKIIAYAFLLGVTTQTDASFLISGIANTLLHTIPRHGISGLWPHFTKNGGANELADSEWASLDTAIAALDLAVALKIIGDPSNQLQEVKSFLSSIKWNLLEISDNNDINPGKVYSHGYNHDDSIIPYGMVGFGMETIGLNWAAASGGYLPLGMSDPPTDNGSGFIENAQFPQIIQYWDHWFNYWPDIRENMVNNQINYYFNPSSYNKFFCDNKLFGLSAAENPEPWDSTVSIYQAYGVGGRCNSPNDGVHDVIVGHYAAMISDIRPEAAKSMWSYLSSIGVISPLNNLESMRAPSSQGKITHINSLKGSWNMALQAEGWANCKQSIRTAVNDAISNCDFLLNGRNKVTTPPLGTELKLSSDHYNNCHERFEPGDHFKLYAISYDPANTVASSARLAVALESSGKLYFWPSWTNELNSSIVSLIPGQPTLTEILNFYWPNTDATTNTEFKLYNALLSDDQKSIRGHFDAVSLEFGPN